MLWALLFIGLALAVMARHRALHERLRRRIVLPVYASDAVSIKIKEHTPQAYKRQGILRA